MKIASVLFAVLMFAAVAAETEAGIFRRCGGRGLFGRVIRGSGSCANMGTCNSSISAGLGAAACIGGACAVR